MYPRWAAEFHLPCPGEPRNLPNSPRNLSNFAAENCGPYLWLSKISSYGCYSWCDIVYCCDIIVQYCVLALVCVNECLFECLFCLLKGHAKKWRKRNNEACLHVSIYLFDISFRHCILRLCMNFWCYEDFQQEVRTELKPSAEHSTEIDNTVHTNWHLNPLSPFERQVQLMLVL